MSKIILYIEDNPNDQRLVQKILTRHGYSLLLASDGEQGIEIARNHTPDMILVDIQMAGLDGLETARRLRKLDHLQGVPVVALTAHVDQYQRGVYIEAGFSDYQQKQAGIQPLLTLVQRHLAT